MIEDVPLLRHLGSIGIRSICSAPGGNSPTARSFNFQHFNPLPVVREDHYDMSLLRRPDLMESTTAVAAVDLVGRVSKTPDIDRIADSVIPDVSTPREGQYDAGPFPTAPATPSKSPPCSHCQAVADNASQTHTAYRRAVEVCRSVQQMLESRFKMDRCLVFLSEMAPREVADPQSIPYLQVPARLQSQLFQHLLRIVRPGNCEADVRLLSSRVCIVKGDYSSVLLPLVLDEQNVVVGFGYTLSDSPETEESPHGSLPSGCRVAELVVQYEPPSGFCFTPSPRKRGYDSLSKAAGDPIINEVEGGDCGLGSEAKSLSAKSATDCSQAVTCHRFPSNMESRSIPKSDICNTAAPSCCCYCEGCFLRRVTSPGAQPQRLSNSSSKCNSPVLNTGGRRNNCNNENNNYDNISYTEAHTYTTTSEDGNSNGESASQYQHGVASFSNYNVNINGDYSNNGVKADSISKHCPSKATSRSEVTAVAAGCQDYSLASTMSSTSAPRSIIEHLKVEDGRAFVDQLPSDTDATLLIDITQDTYLCARPVTSMSSPPTSTSTEALSAKVSTSPAPQHHTVICAGSAAARGNRDYMEDRVVVSMDLHEFCGIKPLPNNEKGSFFAVYDGHNGDAVVSLLARRLHWAFCASEYYAKEQYLFALCDAFQVVERSFEERITRMQRRQARRRLRSAYRLKATFERSEVTPPGTSVVTPLSNGGSLESQGLPHIRTTTSAANRRRAVSEFPAYSSGDLDYGDEDSGAPSNANCISRHSAFLNRVQQGNSSNTDSSTGENGIPAALPSGSKCQTNTITINGTDSHTTKTNMMPTVDTAVQEDSKGLNLSSTLLNSQSVITARTPTSNLPSPQSESPTHPSISPSRLSRCESFPQLAGAVPSLFSESFVSPRSSGGLSSPLEAEQRRRRTGRPQYFPQNEVLVQFPSEKSIVVPLPPPPELKRSPNRGGDSSSPDMASASTPTSDLRHLDERIESCKARLVELGLDPNTVTAESELSCDSSNELPSDETTLTSGSTACVVYIRGPDVYLANLGDSRCCLSRGRSAACLTEDHRLLSSSREVERMIEASALFSSDGYVGGQLGVSRAFGNFEKHSGKKLNGLSAAPDLIKLRLRPDDEFLLIACDGVFDCLAVTDALSCVRRVLKSTKSADLAARHLVDLAFRRRSSDNLSAIVVVLSPSIFTEDGPSRLNSLTSDYGAKGLLSGLVPAVSAPSLFRQERAGAANGTEEEDGCLSRRSPEILQPKEALYCSSTYQLVEEMQSRETFFAYQTRDAAVSSIANVFASYFSSKQEGVSNISYEATESGGYDLRSNSSTHKDQGIKTTDYSNCCAGNVPSFDSDEISNKNSNRKVPTSSSTTSSSVQSSGGTISCSDAAACIRLSRPQWQQCLPVRPNGVCGLPHRLKEPNCSKCICRTTSSPVGNLSGPPTSRSEHSGPAALAPVRPTRRRYKWAVVVDT